jgi:hypothetical protein
MRRRGAAPSPHGLGSMHTIWEVSVAGLRPVIEANRFEATSQPRALPRMPRWVAGLSWVRSVDTARHVDPKSAFAAALGIDTAAFTLWEVAEAVKPRRKVKAAKVEAAPAEPTPQPRYNLAGIAEMRAHTPRPLARRYPSLTWDASIISWDGWPADADIIDPGARGPCGCGGFRDRMVPTARPLTPALPPAASSRGGEVGRGWSWNSSIPKLI